MADQTISNPAAAFGGGTDGYWCETIHLVTTEAMTIGDVAWLDLSSGLPRVSKFANSAGSASNNETCLGVIGKTTASGGVAPIITRGYCGNVTTDGNAVAGGTGLVVKGSGVEDTAVQATFGDISATVAQWSLGQFLAADAGTVGTIWLDITKLPTGTP